ncbi:copper amine oxidase N-terminal domain-containing protein [Paenibacillus sp. YYML68]|uniref:copper amine oxidase N-terminal domain-containing protein n=1 Tax=Paenibacillus sp. YYML68 TaxID=2909250 RepID=UPI0024936515|nr:copper amine oxidase N-terminal domain-containing protein [Paenibacillus sp. YYML68]
MRTSKWLQTCLAASLLLGAISPFTVADSYAASDEKGVSIKLKLGESSLQVNAENMTVEKPFVSNGSTLVPLRVITTAFGAQLNWDSATQTVGLKQGIIRLSLQIGSTTATVNDASVTLEAAPQLVNGTTMVPLRFIAEQFGAKVAFDEATSTIEISGEAGDSAASAGTGIDSDVGKTQIGNSHFGWSMKYPSGLVKSYQSFKEDYVSFEDANGEYSLGVWVMTDMSSDMSDDSLISLLTDEVEEKVLEKKMVREGGTSYAKIVSTERGSMYEYRAYQKGENVFILYFTVEKEADYKNPSKYSGYKDLLDSFTMSFDAKSSEYKDLSTVKDGWREYEDETYGFSLKVPADWDINDDSGETVVFENEKETAMIEINLRSKKEGESLQAWVDGMGKRYEELYLPEYRSSGPIKKQTIDGVETIVLRSSNTFDLKSWYATENVFAIKGDYKYTVVINFTKKEELSESLIKEVLQSLKFGTPSSTLGTIQDNEEHKDRSKRTTVTNKLYNYSLSVPEYWKSETTRDKSSFSYSYFGGGFFVIADEDPDETPSELADKLKKKMNENGKPSDLTVLEDRNETVAGQQAKWLQIEHQNLITTMCVFEKDGVLYYIGDSHVKAVDTEFMKKLVDDTIKSFKITN